MKKVLALLVVLALIASLAVLFTACNKKDEEPTTEPAIVDVTDDDTDADDVDDADDDTQAANLPKAGETVKIGQVSVVIPNGWKTEDYTEGEEIVLQPEDGFIDEVTIAVKTVYGGDHAKEWADAINGNYGGNNVIDNVTIAGKSFYRVKAKDDQNICFADLDDKTYIKVSVMNMSWEDGKAVLDAITIA